MKGHELFLHSFIYDRVFGCEPLRKRNSLPPWSFISKIVVINNVCDVTAPEPSIYFLY